MLCRISNESSSRWLAATVVFWLAACDTTCKQSACVDELDVTVTSATHERFATGHYDIAIDGDGTSFQLECDITSAGGTCDAPKGADGRATASLTEAGDEILIVLPAAPKSPNVVVSKDGAQLVRADLSPGYSTDTSCTGACRSGSSKITLPQ